MLAEIAEFIKKSNLVIWGMGVNGQQIAESLCQMDIEPLEYVDSSFSNIGEYKCGDTIYAIKSPSILWNTTNQYNVIVTPNYNTEICSELENKGYKKGISFICISPGAIKAIAILPAVESLINIAKKRNGWTRVVFSPCMYDIQHKSILEKTLGGYHEIIGDYRQWLKGNPPHVAKVYKDLEDYSAEYIENIFSGKNAIRKSSGELEEEEYASKYVNIVNGMRVTTNQPDTFKYKVHIFGPSTVFGYGVEDKYTVASCLQRKINSYFDNMYKVLNYGVKGLTIDEYYPKVNKANIGERDFVIFWIQVNYKEIRQYLTANDVPFIELTNFFQRPHQYGEIFFDETHLNYRGNIAAAEIIFDALGFRYISLNNEIACMESQAIKQRLDSISESSEFKSYLATLDGYRDKLDNHKQGVSGGIVINANPFTYGHYHIIKIAAQMVDYLFVFVVEEDKSVFPFNDRFRLVQENTKDIGNITVIPSGKFIISNITFPDYFDKDNKQSTIINPSLDIELFAQFIAKKLNISIRFAGEEPEDFITNQYNVHMKECLPLYGIKFIEIPRLRNENGVVSASTVRQLMAEGQLDEVKRLVPLATYEYLKSYYVRSICRE